MSQPRTSRLTSLERLGLRVVAAPGEEALDAEVHVLDDVERAGVRRAERRALVGSLLVGALSALLAGWAEVRALPLLGPLPDLAGRAETLAFWVAYGPVLALVTGVEIVSLFGISLTAVRGQGRAAGAPLQGAVGFPTALALTRAALELPNPMEPDLGVDPRREASRAQLLLASLAYKGRVAASTFLVKVLLRRAIGRAATRFLLAFAAVPVNAVWNVVTTWLVLREGRVRVMGPSAALEMFRVAVSDCPEPSADGRAACLKAVGACVVRSRDLHPNHVVMLRLLRARLGEVAPGRQIDSPERFLSVIAGLPEAERRLAVRCLTIASVIDGRLGIRERALLLQARRAAGLDGNLGPARRLLADFLSGRRIPAHDVLAVA